MLTATPVRAVGKVANQSYFWRNLRLLVPVAAAQTAAYLLLNHFPLFPSRRLPLTWLDEAIPLWTWSVWPYLGLVSSELVLPLFLRSPAIFRRFLVAYALTVPVAFATFLLFPTHYPRAEPPGEDGWSAATYRLLTRVDTPECCFPSGHIWGPALICWCLWRDRPRAGPWLLLWFALGTASVLTTKQHYVWDVLGGLALAAVSYALAGLCCPLVKPGGRRTGRTK